MSTGGFALLAAALVAGLVAAPAQAQAPDAAQAPALSRYPVRPPGDPAMVERGKGLFSVNCSFCHGANAMGGESGPNLVRSEVVLNDKDGELILQVTRAGVPDKGMPPFGFDAKDVAAIAAFIHGLPVGEGARGVMADVNPVVGNAAAGAAYFSGAGKCNDCHDPRGNLAGIGTRLKPRDLQSVMLSGGKRAGGFGAPATFIPRGTRATITLANGTRASGLLDRIDEFSVSLLDEHGVVVTYGRNGAQPRVEIQNPLQRHIEMLHTLGDTDIQNLTAYLSTLK
jgi:mono/diheme cytochrome c family protein